MKNIIWIFISIIIAFSIFMYLRVYNTSSPLNQENKNIELTTKEKNMSIKLTDKGVKYIVEPNKIVSGGPPKDGIPSIDDPKFVSVTEADKWISDEELVLVITHEGEIRVYPLQIMVWHEIVNDTIGGDPVLITYCPLCGTGIAYERIINGEPVEFGTSGKLYNSNLVMYDRKTDTYWSQIDGQAIVGELAGEKLKAISIDTVVWRDWKNENSNALVLSNDTGFNRQYGKDPYGNYYEDSFLFFEVDEKDDRVHPKTVVYGIKIGEQYKAYREDDVANKKEIKDRVGDVNIKITRDNTGVVKIINQDTNEEVVKERGFWFSWYAFHPNTDLYQ